MPPQWVLPSRTSPPSRDRGSYESSGEARPCSRCAEGLRHGAGHQGCGAPAGVHDRTSEGNLSSFMGRAHAHEDLQTSDKSDTAD
ncbi:unnamed protein product [Symbiodinium pilosum]|uniref:Uncharacterized protein n=1 Tax=Symbiodinium pilosum TaxID=2952 RepID=A0A812U793_SYMPI|nr:unnamed protein product [Symbiodinium pilosum]